VTPSANVPQLAAFEEKMARAGLNRLVIEHYEG